MMMLTMELLMNPYFLICLVFTPPMLKLLLFIIYNIFKIIKPTKNLKTRYCSKKQQGWTMIAKVNSHVGVGFCKQFIKEGINCICVGDDTEQLSSTIRSMEEFKLSIKSTSQIKSIYFNFQNATNLQQFKKFTDELIGFDIFLLINNIEERRRGFLSQTSIDQNIKIINTNCIAVAMLTQHIIKSMINREDKSAIIHVSSIQSLKGMSKLSLYSSTKSFVNRFSEGIAFQYNHLDILNLIQILVQSGEDDGILSTNPQSFAHSGLRQLAFESQSFGPIFNQIIGFFYMNFIPNMIYNNLLSSFLRKVFTRNNKQD